jgi:hypothetical protein
MNLSELRTGLETELTWRQDEIRFFRNQLSNIVKEEEKDKFRRALILILYAHFEGFCKFALTTYVEAINDEEIACSDANPFIAAASLFNVFQSLFNTDKKCQIFKNQLPFDEKLHRVSREKDFMVQFEEFLLRKVNIPDDVIDTESNLKPVILRKNLFRLGFKHDYFVNEEGHITTLLNRRNNIAHGADRKGISLKIYTDIEAAVLQIMNQMILFVMDALKQKAYLKRPSLAPSST